MVMTNEKKYVTDAWNIGMRRVQKIVDQEENDGYPAWATGIYSNLPDILVFNYEPTENLNYPLDPIVRVYEVTNYARKGEYVQRDRGERYRDTLLHFKSEKIFVCSFEENLSHLPHGRKFFEQHGIKVWVIGHQE